MRINDWSSDVCSSDLPTLQAPTAGAQATPAACLHCPRNVRPMPQVAAISQQIWDMKYRLKAADGAPVDKTLNATRPAQPRVGKEWVSPCRARWTPSHTIKQSATYSIILNTIHP